MTNFIAKLEDWCMKLRKDAPSSVRIDFNLGPTDRPKRSAWLGLRNERITAQITVWVSGECELEADSLADGSVMMRKSLLLENSADLDAAIREVMKQFPH